MQNNANNATLINSFIKKYINFALLVIYNFKVYCHREIRDYLFSNRQMTKTFTDDIGENKDSYSMGNSDGLCIRTNI